MSEKIHFVCPVCSAEHDRGYINGVDTFRCLRCGYVGHGFHPDGAIDREIFLDAKDAEAYEREVGLRA